MERTVVAGPRANGTPLPRRPDVLGVQAAGGRLPWTFQTLADGRGGHATPDGSSRPDPRPWRLRPGFGVTDSGCLLVGLALALAVTPGADQTGRTLIRQRRLDPVADVLVVPDLVTAARPLTDLPLALLLTSGGEESVLVAELAATTRWQVTVARLGG